MTIQSTETLEDFRLRARVWLREKAALRSGSDACGSHPDSEPTGVFHDLEFAEERTRIDALRAWQRSKFDAGFAGITWPTQYGGCGLPAAYERAFGEEEALVVTPVPHEAVDITLELVAPTILVWGNDEQKDEFLSPTLRGDLMWCQLFSEPEAGSDLASLRTRAVPHGDRWVINGQKVWTSGARHAARGYILCRTDPGVPRHAGLTAFLIDMHAPGVDVRPIRQMSGGASFNEVFLEDVTVSDSQRLAPLGAGWRVALTTLTFERMAGNVQGNDLLTRFERVLALARRLGVTDDHGTRRALADLFIQATILRLNTERHRSTLSAGDEPGPVGSINKLVFVDGLQRVTATVSRLLGPLLIADSGEQGTYAWAEHVASAPGMRIAGGTDEVQRNIIAERILGLPRYAS